MKENAPERYQVAHKNPKDYQNQDRILLSPAPEEKDALLPGDFFLICPAGLPFNPLVQPLWPNVQALTRKTGGEKW